MADVIIIAALAMAVFFIVRGQIRRRRRGQIRSRQRNPQQRIQMRRQSRQTLRRQRTVRQYR